MRGRLATPTSRLRTIRAPSMRSAFARVLAWLEALPPPRRGALLLFALAFTALRDACDRVAADSRPRPRRVPLRVHPDVRPARAAAVVDALPDADRAARGRRALDVVGGRLAEPLMAELYAGSIVAGPRRRAASGRALPRGRGCAPRVSGLRTDVPRALERARLRCRVAGWACSSRGPRAPYVGRFALVGLGVAVLALVRPGNAVLLAFGSCHFSLAGSRRARQNGPVRSSSPWSAAAAWSVHNGIRFDA